MNQTILLDRLGTQKKISTPNKLKAYVSVTDHQLIDLVREVGFDITIVQGHADVIFFGGGADINPDFYGEKPNQNVHCYYSSHEDSRDKRIWKLSKPNQFKVGICRGGQFLNAMSGGKMYQHVSGHTSSHIIYDTLFDESFHGSSSHHQQMIPGEDGEVIAYTEGVGSNFHKSGAEESPPEIEAEVIYYPKTKCLCYQGHPEWVQKDSAEFRYFERLMKEFVQNES